MRKPLRLPALPINGRLLRNGWGQDLDRDPGMLLQQHLEQSEREGGEMGGGEVLVGVLGGGEEGAGLAEVGSGQAGGGGHLQRWAILDLPGILRGGGGGVVEVGPAGGEAPPGVEQEGDLGGWGAAEVALPAVSW